MATFRVGQRVRIVIAMYDQSLVGREATIVDYDRAVSIVTGKSFHGYGLDVDGQGRIGKSGWPLRFQSYQLAPLTDPKADQFIEWVKKIKPEPVAVPVAELERVK